MQALTKSQIFRYACIAFPIAFAGLPIYIFLPEYYSSEYQISLTVLAVTLFVLRLFDGLIDPLIGYFSDFFLKYRMVIFPLAFVLFMFGFTMLCVPIIEPILLNFIVGILLTTVAYSFLTINLNSIGAVWHKGEQQKSTIISWREGITLLGVLCGAMLPVILMSQMSAPQAYQAFALIFVVLMLITGSVFIFWLKKIFVQRQKVILTQISLVRYRHAFDRPLKWLFSSYAITAMGSAIPAVMLIFYSQYVLQSMDYTGLFLFLYFGGAIVGIPLWRKVALKWGMRQTWMMGLIGAVIVFAFVPLLGSGDILAFSIICIVSGFFFATELILPNTLLAELVDNHQRSGLANGFYSLLAFMAKMGFAFATIVCLPMLQWFGVNQMVPSQHLNTIIIVLYAGLPCFFKGLTAVILWAWIVQDKKHHRGMIR